MKGKRAFGDTAKLNGYMVYIYTDEFYKSGYSFITDLIGYIFY